MPAYETEELKVARETLAQLTRIADILDRLSGNRKLADIAAEMLQPQAQSISLVGIAEQPQPTSLLGSIVEPAPFTLPEPTPFTSPESLIQNRDGSLKD